MLHMAMSIALTRQTYCFQLFQRQCSLTCDFLGAFGVVCRRAGNILRHDFWIFLQQGEGGEVMAGDAYVGMVYLSCKTNL